MNRRLLFAFLLLAPAALSAQKPGIWLGVSKQHKNNIIAYDAVIMPHKNIGIAGSYAQELWGRTHIYFIKQNAMARLGLVGRYSNFGLQGGVNFNWLGISPGFTVSRKRGYYVTGMVFLKETVYLKSGWSELQDGVIFGLGINPISLLFD